MITNPEVARQISELMLEFGNRLDLSVHAVAHSCPDPELQTYKQAVGKVPGEVLLEVDLTPQIGPPDSS